MVNFYYHCQRCQLEHENCLQLKAQASILVVVVASGANRFMFWEVWGAHHLNYKYEHGRIHSIVIR